jgi:hypothetical protein
MESKSIKFKPLVRSATGRGPDLSMWAILAFLILWIIAISIGGGAR